MSPHSEHAGDVRAHPLVGQNKPTIHRHANGFKTHAIGFGPATHGHKQNVAGFYGAILKRHRDAGVILGGGLETHSDVEINAALAVRPLELLGDGLVFCGNQVGEPLDNGDFCAEGAPDAGKFDTDYSTAQDDDLVGNPVHGQSLLGSDDATTDFEAW